MTGWDECFRRELLHLIDGDDEVRRKLKELVGAGGGDNEQLLSQIATLQSERDQLIAERDRLRGECDRLRDQLQSRINSLTADVERLKTEIERRDTAINSLQSERDAAVGERDGLRAALNERFPRGFELYRKYQRLGDDTRESLHRAFANDGFAAFICCGAQADTLKIIWDVMQNCWRHQNAGDLQTLDEMLRYCVELVNKSRHGRVFEMLTVKRGDNYDREEQMLTPSSKVQGRVREVCVQGFRNVQKGGGVCKSLVELE